MKIVLYISVLLIFFFSSCTSKQYYSEFDSKPKSDYFFIKKNISINLNRGPVKLKKNIIVSILTKPYYNVFIPLYTTDSYDLGISFIDYNGKFNFQYGIVPSTMNYIRHPYTNIKNNRIALLAVKKLPILFVYWKPILIDKDGVVKKASVVIEALFNIHKKERLLHLLRNASKYISPIDIKDAIYTLNKQFNTDIKLRDILNKKQLEIINKYQDKQNRIRLLNKNLKQYANLLGVDNCYEWDGSIDKYGFPEGKGTLSCGIYIGKTLIIFSRYLAIDINTIVKDHEIKNGRVSIKGYINNKQFNSLKELKSIINKVFLEYEEKSISRKKGIKIKFMDYNSANKSYRYNIYKDGNYKGLIYYYTDSTYNFIKRIDSIGFSNKHVNGYLNVSTSVLYTPQCGNTKSISIDDAIKKVSNCIFYRHY